MPQGGGHLQDVWHTHQETLLVYDRPISEGIDNLDEVVVEACLVQ